MNSNTGVPPSSTRSPNSLSPLNGGVAEERKAVESHDDMSTSADMELKDVSDDDVPDDEETGLTGTDKTRRKQKRRRNTLLDQRIVGDVEVTAEEKKVADQNVIKKSLINGLLIALWYIFSLSISIVRLFSPKP